MIAITSVKLWQKTDVILFTLYLSFLLHDVIAITLSHPVPASL
ncbi:MAG: hypothetical protein RSE29_09925 [Leclercia sp.]